MSLFAQQPAPVIPSSGYSDLHQYRASRVAIYTGDFGQLARYRDADKALTSTAGADNRVVFASLHPVNDYTPEAKESFALRPRERLQAVNDWLRDYCRKNGFVYLDYASSSTDEKSMLRQERSDDGLHPNDAGYKIMATLAEKAIAKALASQR